MAKGGVRHPAIVTFEPWARSTLVRSVTVIMFEPDARGKLCAMASARNCASKIRPGTDAPGTPSRLSFTETSASRCTGDVNVPVGKGRDVSS